MCYHKIFDLFNLPADNNVKLFYSPDNCMSMLEKGVDHVHFADEVRKLYAAFIAGRLEGLLK